MEINKDYFELAKRLKGKYSWIRLPGSKKSAPVFVYDPQMSVSERNGGVLSYVVPSAKVLTEIMEEIYPNGGQPKGKDKRIKWKKQELEGLGIVGQFSRYASQSDPDPKLPPEAKNYKFSHALFINQKTAQVWIWKAGTVFCDDNDLKVLGSVKDLDKMITEGE